MGLLLEMGNTHGGKSVNSLFNLQPLTSNGLLLLQSSGPLDSDPGGHHRVARHARLVPRNHGVVLLEGLQVNVAVGEHAQQVRSCFLGPEIKLLCLYKFTLSLQGDHCK